MQPRIMPGRMWLEDDPAHIAEKVMWLHVIGRLKPGISRQQAQANVDVVFKQVVAELGKTRAAEANGPAPAVTLMPAKLAWPAPSTAPV